jgi:hypothetical protein
MKMKTVIIMLLLLAAFSIQINAAHTTGMITYLEGNVSVSRNGRYISGNQVVVGLILEEYDVVETGDTGYVEIEVQSSNSTNGSIIKVQENTSYYFVQKDDSGGQGVIFRLFAGAISFKVQRLTDNDALQVQTETTTMGVRGTEFIVNAMPDGSMLLTTSSGRVVCTDGEDEAESVPGQVVQSIPNQRISTVSVAVSDLDSYTADWKAARLEALQINLPVAMEYYLNQYENYGPQFTRAVRRLDGNQDIFMKWDQYVRDGYTPPMSEAKQDEITVSAAIIEVRSLLPVYEQVYYTLSELNRLYQGGLGTGGLSSRTDRKLREFRRDQHLLSADLASARYYFRLYLEMKKAGQAIFPDTDFQMGTDPNDLFSGTPF